MDRPRLYCANRECKISPAFHRLAHGVFPVNTFYVNWPDLLLKSRGTPQCQQSLHPRELHRWTSPVHLLDANVGKGKVRFYFPNRCRFPRGWTPCRYPLLAPGHRKLLPARRRESREEAASRRVWKSSSYCKASAMLKRKGGWLSESGMASSAKVTKGIFLAVSLEPGGGRCSCMLKQWR